MISKLNFRVIKDGVLYNMDQMGVWVDSFHIHSPNMQLTKREIPGGNTIVSDAYNAERRVDIGFHIETDSIKDFDNLKHQIYDLFFTAGDELTIVRDLTPDRYLKVVQENDYDIENITDADGGFDLTLTMLDPYLYSHEITQNVSQNPVIFNDGTAKTYPIFEIDVKEDLTYLEIRNKYMKDSLGNNPAVILGIPAEPQQELFVPEELVFHESMQSTSTWQTASDVDNGYIAGEIATDNKGFYAPKFGAGIEPGEWQGPSLQKGIGTPLQDFRADMLIECLNVQPEQMGMMTFYFRDANNNIVGRIGFGDTWVAKAENFGHMQLGNYYSGPREDAYADHAHGWNNFNGMVRIERRGNIWSGYYAVVEPNGVHNWIHSRTRIIDVNNQYTAPIHTVQVAFRLWYGAERTDMHIRDIKIFKINKKPQPTSVPFLAQRGDKLMINTKTSQIRRRGEISNDLLDLQSQMFPLAKGINRLEISPKNAVDVKAIYQKAYL